MGEPQLSIDGAIATITLRRPAQANRLTPDDLRCVAGLIGEVHARPQVLVLLLRGEGRHFCSGYDIGSIGASPSVNFAEVVDALEMARPVTIAALQGGVYGGATDLALACDFRVGARGIEMFMPAARLGLHFYQSGLERYVSRLGLDVSKRLFLSAETLDAEEMKAVGFLTHLVAADRLEEQVLALARSCASMAPLALVGMKHHLNRIARGGVDAAALKADVLRTLASEDLREGQAAWAQKRPPRFQGR
jgi:enoyl-CoA hydratase